MKFVKEKFLRSEFGTAMQSCIADWDKYLSERDETAAGQCMAQWQVYQLALWQFYDKEYCFTRTDDYFGIITEDETDWLMKVERKA